MPGNQLMVRILIKALTTFLFLFVFLISDLAGTKFQYLKSLISGELRAFGQNDF